jgi:hypothetical protein
MNLTQAESNVIIKSIANPTSENIGKALAEGLTAKRTINISTIIFWCATIIISLITFFKKYSLIPLLGLTTCLYLLTGMTAMNWAWFGSWLGIGLIIYFMYGFKKSKLIGQIS